MTQTEELEQVTKHLKEHYGNSLRWEIAEQNPKSFRPIGISDIRSVVRTFGYDKAKQFGFLSIYKSALGKAMGFPEELDFDSFWLPKLSHLCIDPRQK